MTIIATDRIISNASSTDALRDPVIEEFLSSLDVEWDFIAHLRNDAINTRASRENQARPGLPIDMDTVERYVEARRNGDVFPPIIVADDAEGDPLVILSGNHRHESALRLGVPTSPAYRLRQPTAAQKSQVMVWDNLRHGLPVNVEERLHLAADLVHQQGLTAVEAAKHLRIPAGRVTDYLTLSAANERLRLSGFLRPESFTREARLRMNALKLDAVFKRTAEVIFGAKLNSDESVYLIRRVRDAASEQEALDILNAEDARMSERKKRVHSSKASTRSVVERKISLAHGNLLSLQPADKNKVPADLRPDLHNKLFEMAKKAKALADAFRSN